jgi:iron complex outermembrane recepter protein
MQPVLNRWCRVFAVGVCALVFLTGLVRLQAQPDSSSVGGVVLDQAGKSVPNAAVVVRNDATGVSKEAVTNDEGHFDVTGLPAGVYTVEASAPGFATSTRTGVQAAAGAPQEISISLGLASQAQSVDVNAVVSLAAQLAPSGNVLDAIAARSEITGDFIRNFETPIADFGEYVNYSPGTYTLSPNGAGLGQGKTFFRSFPNGDYTMTFDGVPFQDTNSVSQHSWANFPLQWIGGVDFDRSPGTASTVGPANFGGSINLESKEVPTTQDFRLTESYGSWSTNLLQFDYDSGLFGPGDRSSLSLGIHQLKSDGYQTYNYQKQDGGDGKYLYRFSPHTYVSVVGGIVDIWNNTPNTTNPTRQQVALFGDNFLMTSTPVVTAGSPSNILGLSVGQPDPLCYCFETYHVQTDFENVNFNSDLGDGWRFDNKLFTYRYWNKQYYQNNGAGAIAPISVTTAKPSGVDKLNGYRQAGDIATVTKEMKWAVLKFGAWYNWAYTDRYQVPDNPLTETDTALGNFHEHYNSQSFQPFAEFQWKVTSKFTIIAGVKDANYQLALNQYQDNGKTVGCLGGVAAKSPVTGAPICAGGAAFVSHSIDWNSWLPSAAARYRVQRNWSVYAQFGEGSITPPTAAFDVTGGNVTTPLAPQIAKTYQTGSVIKYNRWTLDLDAYYVHYGAGYQNYTDPSTGEPVFTQTGPLNTRGIEMESNFALGHGFGLYINGSIGSAKYQEGQYIPNGGLWVASTPRDVETFMVLYQHKNWDFGIVNKRVGSMYNDNASLPYKNPVTGVTLTFPVDQAVAIDPFDVTNVFVNYTIKNASWLRGSKLGLAVTNLLDSHNIVGVTPAVAPTTSTAYAYSPYDQINILPGRSIMATFVVGYAPKR